MQKSKTIITIIAYLLFLALLIYEIPRVPDYIADTILFMILTAILYLLYNKLNLDTISYTSFIISLLLHNAGAFGWYNISPLPVQWDHITHIVAGFAITLILFRYVKQFFKTSKFHNTYLVLFLILASLGAGSIIEYYEFAGYFIVGEGMGGLGQGAGDRVTEFGTSEWLNTMLDLIYNLIGTIIGVITGFFLKYNKNGEVCREIGK